MKFKLLSGILILYSCGDNRNTTTVLPPNPPLEPEVFEPPPSATKPPESDSQVVYTHELVIDGIDIPWGMAFIDKNNFLVTEKQGILYHVNEGNKTIISGLPTVYFRGQGGLLDVALHPDYQSNQIIYFTLSYSEDNNLGGNTALYSAKFDIKNSLVTDLKRLYWGNEKNRSGRHFGSRIAFDEQGHVYFSIGDRGQRNTLPQDLEKDGGKIYRLKLDGTIPEDNPFKDADGNSTAVFSYGHRNPQGMLMHPDTGEIWIHEHGPKGGDEINILKIGENYGWPLVTFGLGYDGSIISNKTSQVGIESPIHHWTPSIAPSGMEFVTGEKYPKWEGNLLVGSLKFEYLERIVLDDNDSVVQRIKELDGIGRVRSIIQSPDGVIYVGVERVGVVRIIKKK